MHTLPAKTHRPFGSYGTTRAWHGLDAARPAPGLPPKDFTLSAEDSARFLRIVSDCARLATHQDIWRWLGGEVQHFLPHEILLCAWGDFAKWSIKLDLTSGLPGVRTMQLAYCRVDDLVRRAYAQWIGASRQPILLKASEIAALQPACLCPIHAAIRSMRSIVVHGVHDKRTGEDSVFIALGAGAVLKGRSMASFVSIVDPLVHQFDAAFRKVAALPYAHGTPGTQQATAVLDLSQRERQVLESVCRGATNLDIAAALEISPFTVKNHVQRIFRKIGVSNRTQAAARYTEALRQEALRLAGAAQRQQSG
jgi:transcriptional regulator EpsA